ncbi:hypothetical protein SLS54_001706 [Diplodia seriata]
MPQRAKSNGAELEATPRAGRARPSPVPVEKTPPAPRLLRSTAVVMSSLPPDQDEPAWYKCRHCDDQFKREDHLRRHELSHGFPRFLCDHPACGMRFHRKDVLQRHKLVHQPNPLKRRRKPRRGAIPRGPIQQTSDSSTTPPGDFSPPPVAHAHAHAQAHVQVPLPALTPPAASTASQSPPHDLHQLAAQGDSFNLTTEWDYAIHEWPEFGLHPGLPNFVQPSWQNCLMPVFDTTSSPLIPPSLALAHAPNASFPLDAAFVPHPALPLSPQDMRICVDKFRQRFLPRIPFLHYLTCEHECVSQNSALYYTMAMAGSLYLDNYRPKAARMHKLASETLQKQSRMVRELLRFRAHFRLSIR